MVLDVASMTTIGQGFALLKAIIENSSKKGPEATSALAFIGQLQQHMDDLRTTKHELENKVIQAQKENLELQRKNDEREAWRVLAADVELIQSLGGAWVYARHGKPPYFCPACFGKSALVPLQPRSYMGDCPTSSCKACYQIEPYKESSVQVLQRHVPRNQGISF